MFTHNFLTTSGVRLGDTMSSTVFNIFTSMIYFPLHLNESKIIDANQCPWIYNYIYI